eukprot:761234_1
MSPSLNPSISPSISPTTPPTMAPTPLCPNLGIYINDTTVPFNKADFEANYVYVTTDPLTLRPVFEIPQIPADKNLKYIGLPPNGYWRIEGSGPDYLQHGPSRTTYPPYNTYSYWNHSILPGNFTIYIKCVLTFAPIAAPTDAPTTPPTHSPTQPPSNAPTQPPSISPTNAP